MEPDGEEPMWRQSLRFALPRVAVGAAVLAAVGVGLHFIPEADAKRGADGAIAKKGTLDASAIAVGDCYQHKAADIDVAIDTVVAVPCAQPHTAQVVSTYTYVYDDAATNPMGATEDRLKSYSFPGCEAAIEAVVDSTRMPSGLRVDVLMTSYEGWFAGPQDVLCVVVGDSPWTGSVMPRKFLS